jgi:RNA polymerase sigma-70 factor (ECF subfamily)
MEMSAALPVSLETIQAQFHRPLERFIQHRVPDAETAQDLLQEVYLKIHRHLASLDQQERLQAWIYRIARNVIVDYYRSQKPVAELDEALAAPEAPDLTEDISERLQKSIRRMLAYLPDDYRQALILTEYEGLTQQELAERAGISLSGAKSRVQRARKLLREMLLECCHVQLDRYGTVIDYSSRCACCTANPC